MRTNIERHTDLPTHITKVEFRYFMMVSTRTLNVNLINKKNRKNFFPIEQKEKSYRVILMFKPANRMYSAHTHR